jgi:hypothetical protein
VDDDDVGRWQKTLIRGLIAPRLVDYHITVSSRAGRVFYDRVEGSIFFYAVIPRGCDFFDFARKSILKRIELRDKIRVSRNNVTRSERSEESLCAFVVTWLPAHDLSCAQMFQCAFVFSLLSGSFRPVTVLAGELFRYA